MPPDRTRKLVYASLFAALTAVSAWIVLPLFPVPVTLQTFFVILSGAVLGPYFGALSMAVYLLLGFIGLPVFSRGQSGLGIMAGPTGGYLIGFVFCAIITGLMVKLRKNPGLVWYGLAMAAGTLVIYAGGVAWMSLVLHMPPDRAVIVGVLPFLPGDALKLIVASFVAARLKFDRGAGR